MQIGNRKIEGKKSLKNWIWEGLGLHLGGVWNQVRPTWVPNPQVKFKNRLFFRYLGPTWANLGQKGAPGGPKGPKMRPRSVPRRPK